MNKMKNFKRRFSLSVPRTETIEENEFTEQINQLNIRHTQGLTPDRLGPPSHDASPVSPEPTTPGAQSPSHLHYHSKAQHRRFSMEVANLYIYNRQSDRQDIVTLVSVDCLQDVSKRMSLPMDIRLPPEFLKKLQLESENSPLCKPLSRMSRRASLSDIGFGKLETYVKLGKLGEGTYATVFKGRSKLTENLVALKEIRLEHEEGAPCTAIREGTHTHTQILQSRDAALQHLEKTQLICPSSVHPVSLLKNLKHANIVTLHDIIHTDRCLTLVFEYLDSDLKQYLDNCGNLMSMHNVKIFMFQLLRGLSYCHKRKILHRDLKPQNLLINDKGELKLADFGRNENKHIQHTDINKCKCLARAKSVPTKTYSNEVVTLWYRPPDVLLGSTEYSTPIDMWGVGCILYEMATGRPMFPGATVKEELHLIFRLIGTPTEETWPGISSNEEFRSYLFPQYRPQALINHVPRLDTEGIDLLSALLLYDTRSRISSEASLRHPYFLSLGDNIHNLADTASVFSLREVQLQKDPGHRSSVFQPLVPDRNI
eukprot:superscaffoldBa00002953_g15731